MNENYCLGCRDNFYNGAGKKCWSRDTAKVVWRKFVPIWQRPPWDMPAERTFHCHNRDGYVAVSKDTTR